MIGARPLRSALVWAALVWAGLAAALGVPVVVAATSKLLAWRDPFYIAGGLAGVVALALLLVQPLLAGGYLPGLGGRRGRRLHGWVGAGLVAAVAGHVAGLWLTSPPDVIDALLFRSPTPFAAWGVVAMWAAFAAGLLAMLRARLGTRVWRLCHIVLAAVVVVAGVVHAVLIEGTMGVVSKLVLCALVLVAAAKAVLDARLPAELRALAARLRRRRAPIAARRGHARAARCTAPPPR